jgi:hypothetical protein
MIGSGPWAGNGATITPLIAGSGTQFGAGFDPAEITRLQWGSLTIALDAPGAGGRTNGRMRYQGQSRSARQLGRRRGRVQPDRDVHAPRLHRVLAAAAVREEFLGTFWNPARSGEGLMLTQDQYTYQPGVPAQAPRVYALWFTYDLVGNPLWLFGDVTGKDGNYQISFLRPIGTQFGAGFDPNEVVRQPWGSGTVSYSDCNHLTLSYSSTQPGFGAGRSRSRG